MLSGLAAKGAYFSGGQANFAQNSIKPFATGGIVTKPTFFKYADGGTFNNGVMGEAGPEAIMPLKRGADGKLGVAARLDGAMKRYRSTPGSAAAAAEGDAASLAAAGAISLFGYMPFVFSGSTLTKSGDNQPATLAFPNNDLSRGWAATAIQDRWIANVRILLLNPDNKNDYTLISRYVGQIVSGGWDGTALKLNMASVFDAVGADVPRKKLTQQLVGHLPLTSNVRVQ
jgi:hypothetical protein